MTSTYRTIIVTFFGASAFPTPAFAGRPLVIDDAAPVAKSHFELELGFAQRKPFEGGRDQSWPVTMLAYGLLDELEIGLGIQRINQNLSGASKTRGFEDLHLNAKYRFLAEDRVLPALALSFDVRLPTANRRRGLSPGKTDETFLLIATKNWTPLTFHLNLGYTIIGHSRGEPLKNRIRGGSAVEWTFDPQWVLVGEIFGFSREVKAGQNESEFQLGVKYLLTPQLVLDSAVGRSLRSSGTVVQGTVGLTWTVDPPKLFPRRTNTGAP
jgi:hypothetical protein